MLDQGRGVIGKEKKRGIITYWPSSPHPSCVTVGVCRGVESEGAKLSLGHWGGKLF